MDSLAHALSAAASTHSNCPALASAATKDPSLDSLTFHSLWRAALHLAGALQLKRRQRVAIALPPVDAALAVAACLAVGASAIPLGEETPPLRLQTCIHDASVGLVLDASCPRLATLLAAARAAGRNTNGGSVEDVLAAVWSTSETEEKEAKDTKEREETKETKERDEASEMVMVGAVLDLCLGPAAEPLACVDVAHTSSSATSDTATDTDLIGGLTTHALPTSPTADASAEDEDEYEETVEAHVYFTSGSTGTPKAVAVSRAALLAYAQGKNDAHAVHAGDRCLVASAPTFDPWLTDLVACWLVGAVAAVASPRVLLGDLQRCLLAGGGATHVLTTPALFATLDGRATPADFPRLRVVALGGEAMPAIIADTWGPHITLLNTYGVTECCGYQSVARVRAACDRTRLGDALGANRLLLAAAPGDDPRQCVLPGSGADRIGELWIAGPQVATGYLNAPATNAATGAGFYTVPGIGRCYRTGDLVRARADGTLRLLGRRDAQLKVNGTRIEPGEVEAVIRAVAAGGFARVVVGLAQNDTALPRGSDSSGAGGGALWAWCELRQGNITHAADVSVDTTHADTRIVNESVPKTHTKSSDTEASTLPAPRPALPATAGQSALTESVFRRLCADTLPQVMVPRRFVLLAEGSLPLTASGKVDRRALLAQPLAGASVDTYAAASYDEVDQEDEEDSRSQAFSPLEALVAEAWTVTLGMPVTSARADFAALSGDSLAALRIAREVHARLRAAGGQLAAACPPDFGVFGEHGDALAPVHVLALPRLRDYAAYLARTLNVTDAVDAEGVVRNDTERHSLRVTVMEPSPEAMLLRQCAAGGDAWLVHLLLSHLSDALDHTALTTALHTACGKGRADVTSLLLAAGASPAATDAEGRAALHWAAVGCALPVVQAVLAELGESAAAAAVCARDAAGLTPLHHAARSGAGRRVFEALLGVHSDSGNGNGGVRGGGAKTRKAGSGTSGNATVHTVTAVRDGWGRTPLHWAVVNGHRVAAEALLTAGASTVTPDDAGETPLQVAERRAQCRAQDRPDGLRPSVFGDLATLLGGSGATRRA